MNAQARLERWLAWLMRGLEGLLGAAFLCAIALNFANVIGRYAFGRSLLWAEDVQIFVLVWMVFLGAASASFRNTHVRMDLLVRVLPSIARRVVAAVEAVATFALFTTVTWLSHAYLLRIVELGQASDLAGLPMWIPHAAVSTSFGLMALVALVRGVASLTRAPERSPEEEAG